MADVRIEHVSKSYPGGVRALDDITLTIPDGEFMVLLGPSGCGKTTLLRMIAGFEQPDSGSVWIDGRDVTTQPPGRRGLAMVFQSYALFPHLRVFENIAFGLRMHRVPGELIRSRVAKAAQLTEISGLLERYPSQLSGGQRQRVALARALAVEARVILMDEPLSNLDALLRLQMRAELKHLLQEVGATTVYVTHDQVEALSMGDRTAVMRQGEMLQVNRPLAVYDRPSDPFVASFIGNPPMNLLAGVVSSDGVILEGHHLKVDGNGFHQGEEVLIGVRAERVEVSRARNDQSISARVHVVEPLGSHLLVTLEIGGQSLKVTTPVDFKADLDEDVWVTIRPESLRLFSSQ